MGPIMCSHEVHDLILECEGLGNHERRRHVKELVRRCKPDIILLKETKLMGVSSDIVHGLCKFVTSCWLALPAVETVGGSYCFGIQMRWMWRLDG